MRNFKSESLNKAFKKVIDSGYIAAVVVDKNNNNYYNWFNYIKEGEGSGSVQEGTFWGLSLSSNYFSKNSGQGATYLEDVPTVCGADLENALTYKVEPTDNVRFIKSFKDLILHEDFWLPDIRFFKKGKEEFTPFDILEKLEGLYIVKHGPSYRMQIYSHKPRVNEGLVALRIEGGEFIDIKGSHQEQIELLKEAFPYIEESKLEERIVTF